MQHSKGQATIDMEEMDDLMFLEYLEKTKNVKPDIKIREMLIKRTTIDANYAL